ncbi:MAG TPA: hypothetical protein VNQ50_04105 [Xanthobacteraceae bacterium]|jgi:hypothetical protein|nr:hypothetical protein [Xanthobacteraceae bacterium]
MQTYTASPLSLFGLLAVGVMALVLSVSGFVVPASAGDYTLENRPQVVFKGGIAHVSPYPMSRRSASIWSSDACWRDCSASCTWAMESCVRAEGADACVPRLDACDRSCQRACRDPSSGPLLGFIDW